MNHLHLLPTSLCIYCSMSFGTHGWGGGQYRYTEVKLFKYGDALKTFASIVLIHWTFCRKLKNCAHHSEPTQLIVLYLTVNCSSCEWIYFSPLSFLPACSFISPLPFVVPSLLVELWPFSSCHSLSWCLSLENLAFTLICSSCQSPQGPIKAQSHLTDQQIKRKLECVCWKWTCVWSHECVCLLGYAGLLCVCIYGCVDVGWERALNSSSSL